MKKFKSLVIIQIKNILYNIQDSLNVKNKGLLYAMQGLLLIAILAPSVYFSVVTFNAFSQLNQPELLITTMYLNSILLMFFLGIPIIISVFFFSKDIRFLSSLPIKEDIIILSKLCTVYIYLLLVSVLMLLPAIVVYGYNTGINAFIIVFGLLLVLLSPVLPLLISSILVLLFNKIISKNKFKNLLTIVGNMILILIIILFQMGFSRNITDPELIKNALLNDDGLLGIMGMRFPPSIWSTKMILGSLTDVLYFIGINIIIFFILQLLTKYFFKRSLLTFTENKSSNGTVYYIKRSKNWQLLKRNLLIIIKEPTFLLNALLSMIVPVIIFLIMSFSGQLSLDIVNTEIFKPYIILIAAGIMVFPAIVSNMSSTAITREGKSFWQTKVLPISDKANIKYRIMTTVLINLTGSFILGIILSFLLPVTLKMFLIISIFVLITTLLLSVIDFIINIYRPLLHWTHPTAAVKNNLNVTLSLGIRGVIGIVFYGVYKINPNYFSNFSFSLIVISIIFFIFYMISKYYLYNILINKFRKISL